MKEPAWRLWKSLPIPTIFGVGYQVWVGFILGITLGVWFTWWIGVVAFVGWFIVFIIVYGTYEALTTPQPFPPEDSN